MELIRTKMAANFQQIASTKLMSYRMAPKKNLLIIFSKCHHNHFLKFNAYVRPVTVTRVGLMPLENLKMGLSKPRRLGQLVPEPAHT